MTISEGTNNPPHQLTTTVMSSSTTKTHPQRSRQRHHHGHRPSVRTIFLLVVICSPFLSLKIFNINGDSDSVSENYFALPVDNHLYHDSQNITKIQTAYSSSLLTLQSTKLYDVAKIPTFMLEYIDWHKQQLHRLHSGLLSWAPNHSKDITTSTTPNAKFLIMRCIDGDRCGGTSDRLKSFPLFIYLAKKSNRILLIRWGEHRPFPLESFMIPRLWNWTVPSPLLQHLSEKYDKEHDQDSTTTRTTIRNTGVLQKEPRNLLKQDGIHKNNHQPISRVYFDGMHFNQLLQSIHDDTIWLVEGNDFSGGATRYETMLTKELPNGNNTNNKNMLSLKTQDVHYFNFYHHLFHASFQPSSAVVKRLQSFIDVVDDNNLVSGTRNSNEKVDDGLPSLPVKLQPNRYMVAHYRAKFPGEPYRETWNVTILEQTALHAVDCARVRGGSSLPAIYVASDTALAIDTIHNHYKEHVDVERNPNTPHVSTYLCLQRPLALSVQHQSEQVTAVDPPHLNFAKLDDASGFYGIFVDLFLMSYSSCVVYGAGGFGRFGNLVSFHPWCGVPFTRQNGILQQCTRYNDTVEIVGHSN